MILQLQIGPMGFATRSLRMQARLTHSQIWIFCSTTTRQRQLDEENIDTSVLFLSRFALSPSLEQDKNTIVSCLGYICCVG
jgi:hypothetical protein